MYVLEYNDGDYYEPDIEVVGVSYELSTAVQMAQEKIAIEGAGEGSRVTIFECVPGDRESKRYVGEVNNDFVFRVNQDIAENTPLSRGIIVIG